MNYSDLPKATIERLPKYLRFLRDLKEKGVKTISATEIAERFNYTPISVRKDMGFVSNNPGKPKVGFEIDSLISDIRDCLGFSVGADAIVVGVGKLGKAILTYEGFINYGLRIVAGFDSNLEEVVEEGLDKPVYHYEQLGDFIKKNKIKIAIITVPKIVAQKVCNDLVGFGISGIWNFAPTHLKVPSQIIVRDEDMASSLAVLSHKLTNK